MFIIIFNFLSFINLNLHKLKIKDKINFDFNYFIIYQIILKIEFLACFI